MDADVPLLRPSLIRSQSSELRLFQDGTDRLLARHLFVLRA